MIQCDVIVRDPTGLHARPAAVFVQAVKGFSSKITIRFNGKEADAKSIMSVMALGIKCESTIVLAADGADENDAVGKLKAMLESVRAEG
jgi:phosphotransferase system HPr (HPr) family protein